MPIVDVVYAPEVAEEQLAHLRKALPDAVFEVRSTWFESRGRNRQARCDQLCERIVAATGTRGVGVYLTLPVAAWSQSE